MLVGNVFEDVDGERKIESTDGVELSQIRGAKFYAIQTKLRRRRPGLLDSGGIDVEGDDRCGRRAASDEEAVVPHAATRVKHRHGRADAPQSAAEVQAV